MNLPNKLTLLRMLLVPVFMVFVSMGQYGTSDFDTTWYLVAGVVFAAASFTDFLDGYLARKWKMVTDFGKFADPLADKLLTTVAFLYMMRDGVLLSGGAGHHPGAGICCVWSAHGGSQRKGRKGHCCQYVGQGQDRDADADHRLLFLCSSAGRAGCSGDRLLCG